MAISVKRWQWAPESKNLSEAYAQRLLVRPLDHVPHPDFSNPALEAEILAPMPRAEEYEGKRQAMHAPRDVPPELASCYEYPLLDREQERHLFRKMNYLKYRASRLRDQLRKESPASSTRRGSRSRRSARSRRCRTRPTPSRTC